MEITARGLWTFDTRDWVRRALFAGLFGRESWNFGGATRRPPRRVGGAIVNRIAEQSASALTKNDPLCSAQHSGSLLASAEGKISADQNWQLFLGGSGDHLRG